MVLFMTLWAVHVYGFTSELLEITATDLLGLKHRTTVKNSSLLRTQSIRHLPELPAKADAFGLLAKVAERLIVSACLTIWQNDVFWWIEILNRHLWMAQELCKESWRITGSEHGDGRPSHTTGDPCLTVTDGQGVEQIRDTMAVKIFKQVGDNRR